MTEYSDRLRHQGIALNVVPLVGHNTVRSAVLGFDDVQPTPEQQTEMERMVEQAMEQGEGARGLSTGLFYPPGFYAKTDEVIGLARVAARYDGIYDSHIRSETNRLLEAVKKMTSITAERFRLNDRGVIREGAWADLVLFNTQTITDKATYTDPHQYPEGIPFVIVNGMVVIDQHEHTSVLPGQVL